MPHHRAAAARGPRRLRRRVLPGATTRSTGRADRAPDGVPILVGSSGQRMLRIIARYADAWNTVWHGDRRTRSCRRWPRSTRPAARSAATRRRWCAPPAATSPCPATSVSRPDPIAGQRRGDRGDDRSLPRAGHPALRGRARSLHAADDRAVRAGHRAGRRRLTAYRSPQFGSRLQYRIYCLYGMYSGRYGLRCVPSDERGNMITQQLRKVGQQLRRDDAEGRSRAAGVAGRAAPGRAAHRARNAAGSASRTSRNRR